MAHESGMVRLHLSDLDWATGLLTEAFLHEAPTTHLFLGSSRQAQVEYFMRCSCRYALLFGECYTNADRTGVALWLLPNNTTMTPGRMYRAGMLSAPFRMGLPAFSRFMGFAGHTDTLHRVAAPMPHYYLFALGVSPSSQGQGIGRRLGSGVAFSPARISAGSSPTSLNSAKTNSTTPISVGIICHRRRIR